jgi:hypothetical protein
VRFEESLVGDSPDAFAEQLIAFYENTDHLEVSGIEEPMVVVRCGSGESVRSVTEALRKRSGDAMGMHTSLGEEPYLRRSVPGDSELQDMERAPTFWVHQDMLIEGIDRPEFSVLALYEPLRNGRALVQQTGRILRNPDRNSGATAVVLGYPRYNQARQWELYRKYEVGFESNPDLAEKRRIFDETVALTPETWAYEGSRYRGRLDIERGPSASEVSYSLSTHIYRTGDHFDSDEFTANMLDELSALDLDVRPRSLGNGESPEGSGILVESPDDRTWFVPFVEYKQPNILSEHYLLQFDIGFVLWRRVDDLLFLVTGRRGIAERVASQLSLVDAKTLRRAFRDTSDPRISGVTVESTVLGDHSARRRSLSARSIRDLGPALDDHMQVLTGATGYTRLSEGRPRRREVGFSRARVSDPGVRDVPLAVLSDWIDALAESITSRATTPQAFTRFAAFADPPARPKPDNILIDLGDAAERFAPSSSRKSHVAAVGGTPPAAILELENSCVDVDENGSFVLRVEGDPGLIEYRATIFYRSELDRYEISCDGLDEAFIRSDEDGNRMKAGLSALLNAEQPFRVVPRSTSRVYARGHWYEPRLNALNLDDVLFPVQALATSASEKGDRTIARNSWEPDSVFGIVDRAAQGGDAADLGELATALSDSEWLICDDAVLTEVADFIAVDHNERVALFHAKAFKTAKKRSATAFHEVCAQAIKNLAAVTPYGSFPYSHVKHWSKPWSVSSTEGEVSSRIRRQQGSAGGLNPPSTHVECGFKSRPGHDPAGVSRSGAGATPARCSPTVRDVTVRDVTPSATSGSASSSCGSQWAWEWTIPDTSTPRTSTRRHRCCPRRSDEPMN